MKNTLLISLCLTVMCWSANSIARNADASQTIGRISFVGTIVTTTCKIINNQPSIAIDCPGSVRYSQKHSLSLLLGTYRIADGMSTISFKWLNRERHIAIVTLTSV